jgi:hypothetical protein
MTWITDNQQLYAGKWITTAYVGRGIKGAAIVNNGTNGGSIIGAATAVDPAKEYRLQVVSIPAGFTLNENGAGQATTAGVAVLKLFEDGIEL